MDAVMVLLGLVGGFLVLAGGPRLGVWTPA